MTMLVTICSDHRQESLKCTPPSAPVNVASLWSLSQPCRFILPRSNLKHGIWFLSTEEELIMP